MALKTIEVPSEQAQRTVAERGLNISELLHWQALELDIRRAVESAEEEGGGRWFCRGSTWFISSIQARKIF